MEHINDFISKLEKKFENEKGGLIKEEEFSPDIDKHPIDQIDILVAECAKENYETTIGIIKKIIEKYPELIEELLDQIETQKNIAELEKGKSQKIEDGKTKLEESLKWGDKLRALNKLNQAINRKGENHESE